MVKFNLDFRIKSVTEYLSGCGSITVNNDTWYIGTKLSDEDFEKESLVFWISSISLRINIQSAKRKLASFGCHKNRTF